jgi:hypothetical protein
MAGGEPRLGTVSMYMGTIVPCHRYKSRIQVPITWVRCAEPMEPYLQEQPPFMLENGAAIQGNFGLTPTPTSPYRR